MIRSVDNNNKPLLVYKKTAILSDRLFNILKARIEEGTLRQSGDKFNISGARVGQIEGKFFRLMRR